MALVGGGSAFGLGCGIKIWGLFPVLALVVVAVLSGYRTHAARLALAGAGTFTLLCAPFLVMAPTAFVYDILVVQASRNDPAGKSITSRIGDLLYLPSWLTSNHTVVGVTAGLAITIVIWPVLRTRRQPLTALEWYSLASAGLVMGTTRTIPVGRVCERHVFVSRTDIKRATALLTARPKNTAANAP